MKRHKFTIDRLLQSNRFVAGFSVLIAIVIWLVVALQFSEQDKVIEGVKVSIEQSETIKNLNLANFSGDEFTVDVHVFGKRYVLASLTKEDIEVVARTNYVSTAEVHQLRLECTMRSYQSDVQVTGLSRETIQVYFDIPVTKELELNSQLVVKSGAGIAAAGYIDDYERLSVSRITVSGPELEMNRVNKAVATVYLEDSIRETTTLPVSVTFFNAVGTELRSTYLTVEGSPSITATIPVYKRVKMPLTVQYKNAPAYYSEHPLPMVFSPAQAEIGISEERLTGVEKISIGSIDFDDLPAGQKKSFQFPASEMTDMKVLDGTKTFRVTVDTTGLQSKRVQLLHNNMVLQNQPEGMQVEITSGVGEVRVVGSPESLELLTESDVFADIDLNVNTLQPKNGVYKIPARLYVKGFEDCWVYGDYTVDVEVTVG